MPFLGACYGVGTLGVHQGGVVDREFGEPVGAVSIASPPRAVRTRSSASCRREFDAFVGHKEALRQAPRARRRAGELARPARCRRSGSGENLYATQFHPELDVPGIVERVRIYQDAGYFPAEETERVVSALHTSNVVHPPLLLRAFVRRYAR